MHLRHYSSEGIVLARRNYGEADRILVVYTKKLGKISLIAKGVRKPISKKRASLEIFSYIKFAAASGKNLDLITEVETIDSFILIRQDLRKTSLAYFFMEAVGRTSHEGGPNHEVFDLLLKNLIILKKASQLKNIRLKFILDLLTVLGFWPKGKKMENPDFALTEVIEREMNSYRVGKKLLS